MTNFLIQTFIFSAVLLASLLVGIRFLKSQQNNNSTLKEELAAFNSTLSHLTNIEVKFSELQQTT